MVDRVLLYSEKCYFLIPNKETFHWKGVVRVHICSFNRSIISGHAVWSHCLDYNIKLSSKSKCKICCFLTVNLL